MLGLNTGEVKLVSHDPSWVGLFQQEKQLLENLLGKEVVAIEHFGSTAIEDIKAKPIMDIMIGVNQINAVDDLDIKLMGTSHYYKLKNQTVADKIIFAKFPYLSEGDLTKTHYLHFVEYQGDWWNKHLIFRDRLRRNVNLAKEYESIKVELAAKHPDDALLYGQQKEVFVDKVIESSEWKVSE